MKKTFFMKSSDGTSRLYGWCISGEGQPRAVLQIVHGMAEHIGRYEEFAEYMSRYGIAVAAIDLPGHGHSAPDGQLGHISAKDGKGQLIADIRNFNRIITAQYPGVPVFMLGHGSGTYLIRRYITKWGEDPAGVILLGTGSQTLFTAVMGKLLAYTIMKFKGLEYRSSLLHTLTVGIYKMKTAFHKGGSWQSSDAADAASYEADPLCGFTLSAKAYHTFFSLLEDIAMGKKNSKIPQSLPILLTSGMDDPMGDYTEGVLKAYNEYVRLGIQDLDMKFYKDHRHELLHESDREIVFADIIEWIEGRI